MNKIGIYTILQSLHWKVVDKIEQPINPEETEEIKMIRLMNWKDVELPTMSGLKSCMYAKILSLSKDGELYFLISQGATERYYLEIKCYLDSEDTVKEVIYTDNDLEMVKNFAKRYRLYQVAKSLTGG